MRVFISYRRQDVPELVPVIASAVRDRYGMNAVFVDTDPGAIPAGADYRDWISDRIRGSTHVFALIGPHWEPQRLHDGTDMVRFELSTARNLGVKIVPLMIRPQHLGADDGLPAELDFLVTSQAFFLDPASPGTGVTSLFAGIEGPPRPSPPRPQRAKDGKSTLVAVAIGVGLILALAAVRVLTS